MAEAKTLAEKKAELETLQKEIEEAEAQTTEVKPEETQSAVPQEDAVVSNDDTPVAPAAAGDQADEEATPQAAPDVEEGSIGERRRMLRRTQARASILIVQIGQYGLPKCRSDAY